MINPKDWKKYREQVRIYNSIQWAKWGQDNKKRRKEQKKQQEREWVRYGARTKMGMFAIPPRLFLPELSFPMRKSETIEDCLNWVADGRPTFAKKLTVKSR